MLSVDKAMSLVEVKREQWAREREEMSRFYVPWGSDSQYNNERVQIKNQFVSTLELHKQSSCEYQEHIPQRQRSPSLPPIRNNEGENDTRRRELLNRNIPSEKRFAFYDEDGEGDTSGYGSETFNHMNKRKHHQSHGAIDDMSNRRDPVIAWQNTVSDNRLKKCGSDRFISPENVPWSSLSSRLGGSGGEEGRLRWGDRGVATGRLWEPQEPTARLPQMQIQKKGTPAWVERGLNMLNNSADVLVIDQQSNHSGAEFDRSSCNGSDGGRNTFLRGQNVPIEPEIKAQRETKRMKALELQSAILNQLEEREKQRREERERKLKEERLEELRIQRQQEEDKQKLCEERRRNEEKRETEQRKMAALRKAIEDAEQKAKRDKERLYSSHKSTAEIRVCAETIPQISYANVETPEKYLDTESLTGTIKLNSPRKSFSNRTYDVSSPQVRENKDTPSSATTNVHTPRSASTGNINLFLHSIPSLSDPQLSLVPIRVSPDLISPMTNTPNGYQLAVLVPHSNNGTIYNISQPIGLQSLNSLIHIDETSQTGKLLTPRKYRDLKSRDASTQTDLYLQTTNNAQMNTDTDKNMHNNDKDYQNIDENAPQEGHNKSKKERRYRSEERFNKNDIENRPKWGVNRPAAQYKKQSEKDPFYSQKRKMRQKYRPQPLQYLSHSSDDSRSPSPPTQSDTLTEMKSRLSLSQSHWRNKRQDIFKPSNISVETINITPLECNHLGQVTMGEEIIEHQQTMPMINNNMSPSKRVTLSQKFINDKYGNRKLWNDEPLTERTSKSILLELETGRDRKSIIDHLNAAKRDGIESDDQDNVVLLRPKFQNGNGYFASIAANSKDLSKRMRMSKLDDFFDKKKDEAPILDLSKTIVNTPEEYREMLDKVPEFKTRPEKVRAEDIKIKDRPEDQKTKTPRKEARAYEKLGTRGYEEANYTFMDPIPVEMKSLKFEELCTVPIDWKMLTSLRPKSKQDEQYYDKLVELGKSQLRTQARDKREAAKNSMFRKTKNRSGVIETRIVSCMECGEEYCDGKMCAISNYDQFARLKVESDPKATRPPAAAQPGGKHRRLRRRIKRKPRSKSAAPPPPPPPTTKAARLKLKRQGAKSDSEL